MSLVGLSSVMALAIASAPGNVELTIYNGGFALIKEVRDLTLKEGRQQVLVEDVAQMIEPTSVGIRSVSAPGSFSVLEQNYQYDLINTQAILNKAVGHQIVLNRTLPNGSKEQVRGTLMSAPTAIVNQGSGAYATYNGMVLRTDDGRILLDPSGEVEVSSIPEGMISKPTLVWDLESEKSGSNKVELSYISQGMSWQSDYVLLLGEDGKSGDMKGWVTLNNNCGVTFKDAKLKLLAGDVQRARPGGMTGGRGGAPEAMAKMADQGFAEESFSEYHLYTLQRPATVRNKEMKQVSLLEATNVPVVKKLIVDPMRVYLGGYRPGEGEVGTGVIKPQVRIEFKNDKDSHMGMPLPRGNVKVFGRDKSGSVQLIGEDTIDHTPKDETVSLIVGRSFDVRAERKRTKFEWIRNDSNEIKGARETFETEVRNRKDTEESVLLIERFFNEWKITVNSMNYTKVDSNTVTFDVKCKPNEVRKVTYTVETRW